MTSVEEFAYIAAQLEWLGTYLRSQVTGEQDARMESALNALTCAQAVIDELAHLGGGSVRTPMETSTT